MFGHGLTYTSHPVGCAVALKNLDLLEDGILEHAREVAPYFQAQLKTLEELPLVGEVRGVGLMACVECVADRDSKDPLQLDKDVGKRIDAHCHELGLLVRPLINMCVMSPPLIITREQIDDMVGILREGISRTMDDLTEGRRVAGVTAQYSVAYGRMQEVAASLLATQLDAATCSASFRSTCPFPRAPFPGRVTGISLRRWS